MFANRNKNSIELEVSVVIQQPHFSHLLFRRLSTNDGAVTINDVLLQLVGKNTCKKPKCDPNGGSGKFATLKC